MMYNLWIIGIFSSVLLITSPVLTIDTLFDFSDPIAQLVDTNFSSNVYGSDTAWAIDFYATWCGHCQHFAPVWKKLAQDVQDWHRVIRVGAVACSDPINSALCTRLQIWGYPAVRLFPVKAEANDQGETYRGDKSKLSQYMTEYVHKTPQNRRPATWPKLEAARNLSEVQREFTSGKAAAFVIFEDSSDADKKHIGKQVVLDLSSNDKVLVRRIDRTSPSSRHIRHFPSVHKVSSNGRLTLISRANNRKELTASIKSSLTGLTTTATTTAPSSTTSTITKIPRGLHMQDLESSLYYSLWLEIPRHRVIQGETLIALKNYIQLLAKYHPGRVEVKNFLKRLSRWLQRQRRAFSAARWNSRLSRIQTANAYIPKRAVWTGCKGSIPKYRGYPCSLWMTFHALTVSHYHKDGNRANFAPKDALMPLREYIKNFFGCRVCASHFANMSANVEREVPNKEDAIMWLWSRHNRVNKRLAGDVTEDPQSPKIQFPTEAACDYCRAEDSFNNTAVLNYIITFYSERNIIKDVLPYSTIARIPSTPRRVPSTPRSVSTTAVSPTREGCVRNITSWGACSVTCGTGLSQRYSNDNEDCRSHKELRVCEIRPCGNVYPRGSNCEDTFQTSSATRIKYSHCYSRDRYQQKYCGNCANKCCYPSQSRTRIMLFYCSRSDRWPPRYNIVNVRVQWIDKCACAATCPTVYPD